MELLKAELEVFDIIEAEPDRLQEITGIGAFRAKRITDAWAGLAALYGVCVEAEFGPAGSRWRFR